MASKKLIDTVKSYDKFILQSGSDLRSLRKYTMTEEVMNAYTLACRVAIETEKDLDYGLKLSKRVKNMLNDYALAKGYYPDGIFKLEKWYKDNRDDELPSPVKYYYDILELEAPYLFDSYMLYLEKNREYSRKFYQPRRNCLLKTGIIQGYQDLEDDVLDLLCVSMPPSTGKAQPLYSKVLTPNGFVKMGDLKVGDKVLAANGNEAEVLGIYPQGVKPVYELTMADGSKCRCSDEHLFEVQTRDDYRKDRRIPNKRRIIPLKDMIGRLRVDNHRQYAIQPVGKIDFAEKEFIVHPYVMGVLLGDGYLSATPQISSEDMEILVNINSFLPKGYQMSHHDRCTYTIKGHEGNNAKAGSLITQEIKRYGLFGKGSLDKFIPQDYLCASYEQRVWLLRGLMDTDGFADKRGSCSFTTISPDLAAGVVELVRSLGGYASVSTKKTGYKKNGEYIPCNLAYNVAVGLPKEVGVFALTRKQERVKDRRTLRHFIEKIEYVGEEECQCIYISDPSHLYVTDDYIVTHNTTLEKFYHTWIIGRLPDASNLFFSHSGEITRMYYDGIYDITNSDEYTWGEIFPEVKMTSTNAKSEQINFGAYKPFPNVQCTSIGSSNAGKVRCNHLLLCDDLIGGIEVALNKNQLDKLWGIYTVDARQRKMDGCKELHNATRWSVHDVIGRLQTTFGDNDRARFIAVPDIDPKTGKSNFDYDINGFSVAFFENQALLMDDVSYRCLYKNEPIEREGLLYHKEDLRTYLELPMREPDAILGVCDTKNKGTDFLVFPVLYQYDADYYLVDAICDDSADYGVQYENLANKIIEHNMQQAEFESNNGGDRVAFEVEKLVKERGGRCNITTKPTETNKETRIIVNADWVKKNVIFKDESLYTAKSDYGVFIRWLLSYSVAGKNAHDDVPDCMSLVALYITRQLGAKVTVTSRFF